MKKTITILLMFSCIVLCSCGKKKEPAAFDFSTTAYGPIDTGELKLQYGELISIMQNDTIVVVKGKIEPSWNNDLTIKQNYFNISDLIKNHGFNTCGELQYWAVADMTDGSESKVISFTLDKKTIDDIYNGKILEMDIGDHSTDLWILPSLKQ